MPLSCKGAFWSQSFYWFSPILPGLSGKRACKRFILLLSLISKPLLKCLPQILHCFQEYLTSKFPTLCFEYCQFHRENLGLSWSCGPPLLWWATMLGAGWSWWSLALLACCPGMEPLLNGGRSKGCQGPVSLACSGWSRTSTQRVGVGWNKETPNSQPQLQEYSLCASELEETWNAGGLPLLLG